MASHAPIAGITTQPASKTLMFRQKIPASRAPVFTGKGFPTDEQLKKRRISASRDRKPATMALPELLTRLQEREEKVQDLWLLFKSDTLHTKATQQELADAINGYRHITQEIVEALMRQKELEHGADSFAKEKGQEGYLKGIATSVDYVADYPEVLVSMGMKNIKENNPMLMPLNSSCRGMEGLEVERLQGCAEFVIISAQREGPRPTTAPSAVAVPEREKKAALLRKGVEGKVSLLTMELAESQAIITQTETELKALLDKKQNMMKKAQKYREAAMDATGTAKQTRLRAEAAYWEEEVYGINQDVKEARIMIFNERQEVRRKRLLKEKLMDSTAKRNTVQRAPTKRQSDASDAVQTAQAAGLQQSLRKMPGSPMLQADDLQLQQNILAEKLSQLEDMLGIDASHVPQASADAMSLLIAKEAAMASQVEKIHEALKSLLFNEENHR
ncbi:unnamed protein product [Chrysoparadoxa australica]